MGCQIALWLDTAPDDAQPAFLMAKQLFQWHEQALSRFDPDSELSWLNGRPGKWTPVSPLLWDVLQAASRLNAMTLGLFDPTLLPALRAAGYAESFDQGTAVDEQAVAQPGRWPEIGLDPLNRAVFLPDGVQLDLGGIAKGFTAQAVADFLSAWGPCLVDAGGDLTAVSAPGNLPGWPVAVASPAEMDLPEDLFGLWLADASLATSGVDYRRWQTEDGRTAHHIIHPETGRPAETDVLTATVLGRDAATAEGWATAVLVSGMDEGLGLLSGQSLPAVLVSDTGQIGLTPAMSPLVRQVV